MKTTGVITMVQREGKEEGRKGATLSWIHKQKCEEGEKIWTCAEPFKTPLMNWTSCSMVSIGSLGRKYCSLDVLRMITEGTVTSLGGKTDKKTQAFIHLNLGLPLSKCIIRGEQIAASWWTNCTRGEHNKWDKQTLCTQSNLTFPTGILSKRGFLTSEIGRAQSGVPSIFYANSVNSGGLYGSVPVTVKETFTNYGWQVICREFRRKTLSMLKHT